jgi:signal transduction histidine kinase
LIGKSEETMANTAGGHLPMPFKHFRLFLLVWHVLYLGVLIGMLALVLVKDPDPWRWRNALLAACVLGQVALYVVLVMHLPSWPLTGWRAIVYFGGSLLLWAVEWQIDNRFAFAGWMNAGQMFGMLQPWFAIPGATLVIFTFYAGIRGWDLTTISVGEIIGWLGMIIVSLYIYSLFRASVARAFLIDELQEAKRALEESRRNEIELAALRERERLAREMHDGLGHTLAALSVQLEAVQRLYRVDPERASAQVDALKALTRASMAELRSSLAGLRAPGLEDRSFEPALQALCTEFEQRSGIKVVLALEGDPGSLPAAVTETLWRVAQEALTNVEKHAGAQQVTLTLAAASHQVNSTSPPKASALPVTRWKIEVAMWTFHFQMDRCGESGLLAICVACPFYPL